jgi:hypothetical protein
MDSGLFGRAKKQRYENESNFERVAWVGLESMGMD